MSYEPLVYRDNDGDRQTVADGGTLRIKSVSYVAGTHRLPKVVRVALTAAGDNTAGAVVALANPESADVLITKAIVHTTTEATGAANADFGVAADATTSADTLMDGIDIGTAAGVFDNIDDQGTNGLATQVWGSTQYITGTASADATGLVGYLYVEYIPITA